METVNITLRIDPKDLFKFQDYIKENYELIGLSVIPNTTKMYEEDKHFKKLVKALKEAQKQRDIYINDNLNKYKDENK